MVQKTVTEMARSACGFAAAAVAPSASPGRRKAAFPGSLLFREVELAAAALLLLFLLPLTASPFASAQYNVERSDPFAMLSATLQTYQGRRRLSRFSSNRNRKTLVLGLCILHWVLYKVWIFLVGPKVALVPLKKST